jgi:hypothetical protein
MFDTICDLIPQDPEIAARARTLDILNRVLSGRLYDVLPYQFHEERSASGEYIPLRQRRPSVRYNLCRIVVEDSVSLLFSEGHFPTIDCPDGAVRATLADIAKEARLNLVLTEAAIRGAVGSVALLLQVLAGRVFVRVLPTAYLSPVWDPRQPDTLMRVAERYKVGGQQLAQLGYAVNDPSGTYWFEREWNEDSEIWFQPQPVGKDAPRVADELRSVRHGLGFVPIVWIRNLPGFSATGDDADGACTFGAAIETQIEIEYQLSQAGRGLKYSSDPTLLIKEPASRDNQIIKGAANALVVSEKGDARLLEIGGTASAAVMEYVRSLREFALESMHGSRANADRLTAAQSGRALEMMNQGLVWLADNLRTSYGETALLSLARMILQASRVYRLRVMGREVGPLDTGAQLSLKWPRWYAPTADDRQKDAVTLATLVSGGELSRETAVKSLADTYDVEDIAAELARIAAEHPEMKVQCPTLNP